MVCATRGTLGAWRGGPMAAVEDAENLWAHGMSGSHIATIN